MRALTQKLFSTIIIIPFLICAGLGFAAYSAISFANNLNDPQITNSANFLNAVFTGDEHTAQALLSSQAKLAVAKYCQNKRVTQCFRQLIPSSWGNFQVASYETISYVSPTQKNLLFPAVWKNRSALVVISIINEQDQWLIDGWRGFVPLNTPEDERNALLDGTSHTNQFPPPQ